jgi:hypothetical protein
MTHFIPKIRPIFFLILLVLIGEAIAICLLIQQGWFINGDRFRLTTLVVLTAIPGAILVGCLARGTTRFSIWHMLIGFALLSFLFAWLTKPILEFRAARTGSLILTRAGCSLTTSAMDSYLNPRRTSPWMDLFLHDCSGLPSDNRVSCIVVHDDQQLGLLVDNAARFPALRSITFYNVSTVSLEQFVEIRSEFDQLIDVWSHNVIFPPGWFHKLPQLQSIGVNWHPSSTTIPIHLSDIQDIAAMSRLTRFSAAGIGLDDEHAEVLGSSRFIKEIVLRRTEISESGLKLLKRGLSTRQVTVLDSRSQNEN